MQDQHVVECSQQSGIQQRIILGARHLADDDLSVRGGANNLVGVTRRDTRDVRPIEARPSLARRGIVVTVPVVVGEGELLIHIDAGLPLPQLGLEFIHSVLRQGRCGRERGRERLVRHVDTRVDDGDDLPLALLSHLVGAHHELDTQVCGILPLDLRGPGAALRVNGGRITDVPLALQEGRLDTRHTADLLQAAGGGAQREAIQDVGVLPLHPNLHSWKRRSHGLVHGRKSSATINPFLELHDDADKSRRVPVDDFGNLRCLPVLRGQRRVKVADRQGRGRGILRGNRTRAQR